jgi:hypothetical protein
MTADDLQRIGEGLYGPNWQGPMATALEVNITTMRRWARGGQLIPSRVATDIVRLIALRRDQISALLAEMAAMAE